MPITVTTTDGGLGSIMRGEGLVTGQEILNGIAERFSSEEKTRGYIYGISDYTNVEKIEMSSAEVRQVAENDVHMARLNADLVIVVAQTNPEKGARPPAGADEISANTVPLSSVSWSTARPAAGVFPSACQKMSNCKMSPG